MLIKILNIYLLFTCILASSIESDLILNKQLNYNLEFKGISAGSAFIQLNENINNDRELILKSELITNRFTDFFYKIRDYITVTMNRDDISLITLNKEVNEGNFKKKIHIEIVNDTIKNLINNNNLIIKESIYSPLSIIYALRKEKLNVNDKHSYNIYNNGKIKKISVITIGNQKISSPFGTYDTIVVSPIRENNSNKILRNNGDMKIWYTNNKDRIPVKIEIKINYGSIVLLLDNIS